MCQIAYICLNILIVDRIMLYIIGIDQLICL